VHILITVAASSSENSVTIYQSTRCYITKDFNINQHSLAKIKSHKATLTSVLQQSQTQTEILQTHGTMQNSMVTRDESTSPFSADLPLTGQDTQHCPTRVVGRVGVFSCQTNAIKTAPLTNTVLQFSNFNRDSEQIERNENILPKAKYIIEASCNSNAPKWQHPLVTLGSVITRFTHVMKSDRRA
jgi:hypothetical protein